MTGRMSKRQMVILACLVIINVGEKVKDLAIHGWTDFATNVHLCLAVASAAALAISGFLMKSDGHTTPEASDAPRPPAE